jgi:hypothetical protein
MGSCVKGSGLWSDMAGRVSLTDMALLGGFIENLLIRVREVGDYLTLIIQGYKWCRFLPRSVMLRVPVRAHSGERN